MSHANKRILVTADRIKKESNRDDGAQGEK
jgi:hypothetical protein